MATASVDYELILFEDRKHWGIDAVGSVGTVANWIEEQIPDATQYAVFNRGENLAWTTDLDFDRSMRGLIADGNNATLNLASNTLTLTEDGASKKNYNILVGEGYNRPSSLTLRNGIVNAEKDVYVGFDNGSTENVNTGTLNVHDGVQLTTPGLVQLSNEKFTEGVLDIKGAGSKVAAAFMRIGKFGTGTATVREGAEMSVAALEVAKEPDSIGTLTITGPGSKFTTNDSDIPIGLHGRGEVTVQGGALVEWGGGSAVAIGDVTPHFAEVRIEGTGTTSNGASFLIFNGAVLDVRDKASLTSRSATGLVKVNEGGTFRVIDATVDIRSLVVDGGFVSFTNRADVTLESLTLPSASTMEVTGTGTKLRVNGDFTLGTGNLQVGSGAEFFTHQLLIVSESVLKGVGTLHCDQVLHPDGSITPGLSPGILTIDGDYAQSMVGLIEIEIGGPVVGEDYDQLVITGNATMNGIIVLKFINGYTPAAGQQFNILDAGGSLTGNPRVIVQGLEPGWQFTTGFDALTGEFSINSTNDGTAGTPPGNDLNNLDGDADSNFMEFAFGTDMMVSDSGVMAVAGNTLIRRGSPTVSVTNTPTGVDFRALFCQRKDRASLGLTYTVQFSADLATWQNSTATPTLLADDGDYEAVSVRYPFFVNGKKARFFRVAVSTP